MLNKLANSEEDGETSQMPDPTWGLTACEGAGRPRKPIKICFEMWISAFYLFI